MTAASSTSGVTSAPATASCRWHSGPASRPYGSISALTLPADNGTWSVTLVARSGDRALLGLKDSERWERTVRALPTVAHWLDGDPIEDRIMTIAKIEDRHRDLRPGRRPGRHRGGGRRRRLGLHQSLAGAGASIGMLHAQALRDTLRRTGPDDPVALLRGLRGRHRGHGRALVPGHAVLRPPPAGRDGRHRRGLAL